MASIQIITESVRTDPGRTLRQRRVSVLLAILSISLATLAGSPGMAERRAMKPDRFDSAYRKVLATLAEGQEEQALAELYELEMTAMQGRPTTGRIDHFWRQKLGVIRELVQAESVELLVPVVVLHHDAYVMYREREERELAAHSRQMAAELAEYYGNKSEREDARLFTGWVLTSFGAYLQDFWALSSSAELFERALQRDPHNLVALVRLAASFEKNGEYEEAVKYFARAAELRPSDNEVAVRLALCQARMDEAMIDGAIRRLEAVVATGSPSWILSIAYQELARLFLASGRSGDAERFLRDGLEKMPGDQFLAVELSQLLDRKKSPKEAARVLSDVQAEGWEGNSPRYLYNKWPEVAIDETRANLRSTLENRMRPLEAGLMTAPVEEAGR